ncbi:potassium transporter KefA [Bremerella cremea]|uniref:Potassium transporter KefA n=1 Tax=Bremerella cremea TaxID=1031537 RepID=A0A368KSA1_9BACT|nr:mechanosensitive ion channel domain-containing protein [Bremerella cremea]RCS47775.1 potassium transporter KefA [Bremerella cremea]
MTRITRLSLGVSIGLVGLLATAFPVFAQQYSGPIPITVEGGDTPAQPYRGPMPSPYNAGPGQQRMAQQPQQYAQPIGQQTAPPQRQYAPSQFTAHQNAPPQNQPPQNTAPQPDTYQPSFGPNSVPQNSGFATQGQTPPVAAQTPGLASTPPNDLTLEKIESQRKEAEEATDLDEEKKKKIAALYQDAAAKLKEVQELATKVTTFSNETNPEVIQQTLDAKKKQLAELQKTKPESFANLSLQELEQSLAKLELDITNLRGDKAKADAEPKRRSDQRKTIRQQMVDMPNKFGELRQQLEAIPADEAPLVAKALKADLHAKQIALFMQYRAMEAELAKYDSEDAVDMVRVDRDLAAQNLALAEQKVKAMAEQIKVKRAQAAEEAVRQARQQLIMVQPVLRTYAEHNQELAESIQDVTQQLTDAEKSYNDAYEEWTSLRTEFNKTKEKVDQLGLTNAIGVLLRKQRTELIEKVPLRADADASQARIDEAQFKQFEYEDDRKELMNKEAFVQQVMAESDIEDLVERNQLEEAARELFDKQQSNLDKLIKTNQNYIDKMVDLKVTEDTIAKLIAKYQAFIDERVLWIRSGNVLATEIQLDDSDREALSPAAWIQVGNSLWSDVKRNMLLYVVVVSLFLALVIKRGRLKNDLRELGELAQKPGFFGFMPTIHALLYSLLLSAINPAFMAFIAWRLMSSTPDQGFANAVGNGLFWTAVMWFPLELIRNICRGKGLGESHFKWPESSLRLLGRSMAWLTPAVLPLTFITSAFYASDPTHGHDAFERICFILQMVMMALFLGRILHPTGVFQEYIAYNQGGWFDRLKYVWYWCAVVSPLALAGLAFWGYYYTAQVLSWRLFATLCCVLGLMLIRASVMRWIMLARRRLSIAQARERAAAAAAQTNDSAAASLSTAIIAEQAKTELSAHSAQTQRLLTTGMFTAALVGMWLIWSQVMPALSMLDDYSYTIETNSQVADASNGSDDASNAMTGIPKQETNEEAKEGESQNAQSPTADTISLMTTPKNVRKITILTIAFAGLILVLTLVFARDVPGVMEMAVLQRLPLEPSVRYAITSLTSYGIVMLGVVWAFSTLGLQWSQIQWLATALTFGLAFGLQEMFANFVAGIIILFERPIRVGDIVTIHDVTGVVSRIRIRATSITNWDRKEYVVPNKEFITGRLLNWTLTDTINRVVINVGVAYGTNTEEARRILLEIAEKNQYLLKDPAPSATFEGFGDSTLDLVLRGFLPNLENRLAVITDLHTQIDLAFRDAKIEIAFPQRDLHIRTAPGVAAALGVPEEKAREDVAEKKSPKRGAA